MDAWLRRLVGSPVARRFGRLGRWLYRVGEWTFMTGISAALGALIGTFVWIVLNLIGVAAPIKNDSTNWWAVIGGTLGAIYGIGALIWLFMRARRETRREEELFHGYERESAAAILQPATVDVMTGQLTCPNCGTDVHDTGRYTSGPHHARHQRATCSGCGAHLLRHPDLPDHGWVVEKPAVKPEQ